ncbi:MAG: tRNA (adenosine(37)-N6)-threonylcarbamoyltransferase complex ATPase subunit type 1 TsaE [Myxococcaceae bacterium]
MEPLSIRWTSHSTQETRKLGAALGRLLQPGDFVALIGELGAGKTEFARGVAEGCSVPSDEVASPTFALLHRYRGRIPLLHADLFRLAGEVDLYGTGYFELRDSDEPAVVVEWADRIASAVPPDALRVHFAPGPGEGDRHLTATASGPISRRRLGEWANSLPGLAEREAP